MPDARDRQEAVAEVRLGGRADADRGARVAKQVELVAVRVRGVDDRRPRAEAALAREQLDRPQAVLGQALLDLERLLVGVDVKRQLVLGRVPAELAQRLRRAGPDGVGGDPDRDPGGAERLELGQVLGDRVLPEARDAAAQVTRVQADERDPGLLGCLGGRAGLGEAEVVELADRRVPVGA